MENKITSQMFYVNSRQRLSGTHSNFTYEVPIPTDSKFTHACVMSASVPKSFYLVANGRNTFTIQEDAKTATITVPVGNYTRSGFQIKLTELLNTASPNG